MMQTRFWGKIFEFVALVKLLYPRNRHVDNPQIELSLSLVNVLKALILLLSRSFLHPSFYINEPDRELRGKASASCRQRKFPSRFFFRLVKPLQIVEIE